MFVYFLLSYNAQSSELSPLRITTTVYESHQSLPIGGHHYIGLMSVGGLSPPHTSRDAPSELVHQKTEEQMLFEKEVVSYHCISCDYYL